MRLQQALTRSVCAERSVHQGRMVVCQSPGGGFDLYLADHWVHSATASEMNAELSSVGVDVLSNWSPVNPKR
jgi:hypothetical protein